MAHSIALENTLKEICEGLRSSRVTDRKKNGEKLKDFLNMNATPALLTENTVKRKGYTWIDLFDDINDYVLKETEKYETSKTFDSVTAPLCTSLLHLCVAGSNKGKAYIKCDKITEACLLVLKDSRLKRAIGDAYLNLLYRHVLPQEYYLGFITPTIWGDLLDVCLSASISNYSKLDDFAKLRIVLLVMKNATNYCQFVIQMRDSLPKWKKCFLKVVYDKKAQEVVIDITNLLLETLSGECRQSMCHFMEDILVPILKIYDQGMDQKKKNSMFKLLHHCMSLHHPLGRRRGEDGCMADNWDVWNKQLHNILEVICLEVNCMQKIRKPTDELLKQCESFYHLAAAVYFQIFAQSESVENDVENTSKRQKLSFNKNKTFNDLVDDLRQCSIPWLGIVLMYVKNYGYLISIDDYLSLMKVIQSLVTSNNMIGWCMLEDLACSALQNMALYTACRQTECETIILSLWDSCVRNSISKNSAHKAIHSILQCILSLDIVNHQNASSLFKFYTENGMPVTCDSVKTLSKLFQKFFSKYSYDDIRSKFFRWLAQKDITTINIIYTYEIMLRLMSNENISISTNPKVQVHSNVYDTLFKSNEKCILFSEFELEINSKDNTEQCTMKGFEINSEMERQMRDYFKETMIAYASSIEAKDMTLIEYIKFINVVAVYMDLALQSNIYTKESLEKSHSFRLLQKSLAYIYTSVESNLNGDVQIPAKVKVLESLKDLLLTDLGSIMSSVLRSCIHKRFFQSVNKILMIETISDDDEDIVYAGGEREMNVTTLKHSCTLVIAAYCKKEAEYREDLIKHILDPKMYDFSIDAPCLFQCIEMLSDTKVYESPSELLFNLMQNMVRDLYRNPEASHRLLKNVMKMLETVWSSEGQMKQNCHIMMRSYVTRCEKLHYPPHVAALIYECVARTAMLNRKHNFDVDNSFENALMGKIKGDVHTLRIYCCYLLKIFVKDSRDDDTEFLISKLSDIFKIDVTEGQQQLFLKDELRTRTLTVLHCYLALAQTKKSLIHHIVTAILCLQKEKCLDKPLVKKVLKEIVSGAGILNFENYVSKNIVSILYFWCTKKYNIDDLPVHLLGSDSMNEFKEKYKKWVVSADILWRKGGDINSCDFLKQSRENNTALTVANLVETCFSEIIVLCLPYMVTEKYALGYRGMEPTAEFKNSAAIAQKLFHLTGQILENMKWTDLFVENVGDLVLMTALQLWDCKGTMEMFDIKIPEETKPYGFRKEVFSSILEYFGDLTGGNIMQYLCENQPIAIFQVLFSLWKIVLEENIIEFKLISIHAFITFFEFIPRGLPSDAFVCNFICKSFTHGIRNCRNSVELLAFSKAVKLVLENLLPDKAEIIRQSVNELVSVLNNKQKESFDKESGVITHNESRAIGYDVTDYVNAFPKTASSTHCASVKAFQENIQQHITSLRNPSLESLTKLRNFLTANKHYLTKFCKEMNSISFSEDCKLSTIHQLIHALSHILKLIYHDDKMKIEACNALSEIVTYDLKTLVTVPPANTQKVVDIAPKHFMACMVLKSLSQVIFDDDPVVTEKVTQTLNNLLKTREGNDAIELEQVDRHILKPLTSPNSSTSIEIKIHNGKFDQYCSQNSDGIFIKALTTKWNSNDSKNHGKWLKQVTTVLLHLVDSPSSYFDDLLEVCAIKSSICQKILPPMVGLLLHCSSEKHVDAISKHINNFFNYIWEQTFDDKVEGSADSSQINTRMSNVLDVGQKMVVQYMLNVVDFVRLQKAYYKSRPNRTVESLNYLRLDYDKVAWAATVADQHLAAIYYGELWAVAQNNGVPPSAPEATTSLAGGENVQRIFRKCYVSIGEMDAIDGCGTAHLTIEGEKRRHLINTGQYADSLLLHDIALSCGGQIDPDLQSGVVRSLHKSGMHHLALQYIKSLPENDELNDIKYECLSFLGDWSEIVDSKDLEDKSKQANCDPYSVIKAFHYACLRDCLNAQTTENENKLVLPLNRAKLAISRLCQNLNMENCQSVYKVLSKLHLFVDVEEYYSVKMNKMSPGDLLSKWQVDNLPIFNDFKHLEALVSQRVLILEHAAKTYNNLHDKIVSLQIQYAKLGLSNNRVQMSQRLLAVVKKLKSSEELALVESEISWAKGQKEIALSLLRNVVTNDSNDVNLTARSLRQYALWIAESKRESARDIIDKYLLQSLGTVDRKDVETRLKVYHDVAKFADTEYKQVVAYMNSSLFETKVKCIESMRGTASTLRSTPQPTSHEKKAYFTNERFKNLDEAEVANTRTEKESFLHLAMRYYMLSLKECEENNLSVFRVISLWVNNPDFEFNASDGSFATLLQSIPSRKFITVLPQLAPRLTVDDNAFAENLRKIIKRCAIEHPHHTLPILFALKNADKDRVITNAASQLVSTQAISSQRTVQEPRTAAAEKLVQQLATESRQMALIVKQMESICDATISLANFKDKNKASKQKIPSAEQITKLKNLYAIPLPTVTIPVNNDCKYINFPKRCAIEHPHHTLPILFALKNADKDRVITNAASQLVSTQAISSQRTVQEPRTAAAEKLVQQLATESRQMALIVKQMESICDATISLANFKDKNKASKQKIPSAEQITKLKNLYAIPLPTVTIPVNNDCKYINFPSLVSFESYFELVGGINCPKKVCCTDSTGQKRIVLIKGEDDMRQDAVMQQVFNIVNTLLEKNPVTSRNKLLIRTYKVVPMSKQSGVLEWCDGTIPIGGYLVGTQASVGAHSRYRPEDITCSMARKKIQECHDARKNNKEKLLVFLRILREFKPVFHYFFTEHYLDPVTWYERRLAYTKSVATSSMVGYIIGLGDRHVQNILVDKRTAEVIHIDFGIAFDQGKTLNTPETVPFRLTQDIIAGFGSSGVEGIFRGCCEKTMQLLRDNSETLLTILEVLLCDPLYSWTVTSAQQNPSRVINVTATSGSNSGLAERALLAVSSKLSGTEGGAAGGVAVPGQVARLLTAAADPANLCKLYSGWQAYL